MKITTCTAFSEKRKHLLVDGKTVAAETMRHRHTSNQMRSSDGPSDTPADDVEVLAAAMNGQRAIPHVWQHSCAFAFGKCGLYRTSRYRIMRAMIYGTQRKLRLSEQSFVRAGAEHTDPHELVRGKHAVLVHFVHNDYRVVLAAEAREQLELFLRKHLRGVAWRIEKQSVRHYSRIKYVSIRISIRITKLLLNVQSNITVFVVRLVK